jgi:hypothetical protein
MVLISNVSEPLIAPINQRERGLQIGGRNLALFGHC